jgi:hypothetical protein
VVLWHLRQTRQEVEVARGGQHDRRLLRLLWILWG